jgi:insulysin
LLVVLLLYLDGWRNYQFLKSTSHPNHPFAKFGCGNYETLSSRGTETLLQELRNFWQDYYQTYNLRLSVAGHASLDALQVTVEDTFGQLPRSDCSQPGRRVRNNPLQFFPREHAVYGKERAAFGPNQLSVLHRVRPLTETRLVKIHFAVPPLHDPVMVRGGKPYRTISHILGHESPGSLHALLNAMGYTTGLSSGVAIDSSDFCLFGITVSLTPLGMKNYQHVLDLMFQWIALIKRHVNEDQLFLNAYHEELRQIAKVNFKFRENDDPADFVSSVADLMFDYGLNDGDDVDANIQLLDPRRILLGSSETADLDPAVTRQFLDRLRPENAMIVITSSDFNDDSGSGGEWTTEPRYGAQSQVEPLTENQKRQWEFPSEIDARLHMPALNAYVPSDFSLRCDDDGSTADDSAPSSSLATTITVSHKETMAPPVLLIDEKSLRLWHKMDRYWRVPKAFIKLAILSPDVYRSPRTMTYSRIFQRVLSDDLNSFVYDAIMAGCSYRVTCTPSGFRVSVGGYSEKLAFLLDTLTCRILSLIEEMKAGSRVGNASEFRDESSLQSKFDKATESLLRETKNFRLDPPVSVIVIA